jgi:hypothetical protein
VAPGDYNWDMTVDADDYAAWVKDFGGNGSSAFHQGSPADGNYNGVADAGDYVIWRKFASAAGAGAALPLESSVPEPATLLMVLVTVGAFSILRSRSR